MAMETDDSERVVPFQLQFDKPVPSQIKIAEWNPEKDLLAMVTDDSKILLHRFNWQRLWTISPGKCITSLCWRPDGKAIAVGLEDGSISLHNVENGKLLRSMKSHSVAVVGLNWEEEDENQSSASNEHILPYEDRTFRFFPPPPRAPRMPGVVSGDTGFMDESEDSFQELLSSSHQRFNILCSADRDGNICFSIFGVFPIGKINIHQFAAGDTPVRDQAACQILNATIYKVALSKDLCRLIITFAGTFSVEKVESRCHLSDDGVMGFHCLVLDTSIFRRRRNELHQVAQQASNIENLTEVVRTSLSVMHKQWCDAMHTFNEKFNSLSTLIVNHGMDSTAQEEFLSLLGGARTSPSVHQFLVNSLGDSGLKRVSKVVCSIGKELQLIVLDHLQPAAEIIGFRIGELRGLSRWRARYGDIGLHEKLIDNATERVGMFLVQVERFMKIISSVVQQFTNFFNWLQRSIKILMSEPTDQLPPYNSELVVIFLKFLYDQDPVGLLLEQSAVDHYVEIDLATAQRVEELVKLGGFFGTESMRSTLAKEFQHMELRWSYKKLTYRKVSHQHLLSRGSHRPQPPYLRTGLKEAFCMPYTTVSRKVICQHILPLCPFQSAPSVPSSVSFYKESFEDDSTYQTCHHKLTDCVSFRIPDGSLSDVKNCIGVIRGAVNHTSSTKGYTSLEALILSIPNGLECVDLCLYKEGQLVLIMNETKADSDSSGSAHMMIIQAADLPFTPLNSSSDFWTLDGLKDSVLPLRLENEKVRSIPHKVVTPLAVSASRGVACVFATRKRALVYILDEDEEEASDMD